MSVICDQVTIKDDKLVRQWGDLKWLDSKKDGIRFTNDRMLKLSADYSAKASEYEEQQKEVVDKVLDVTKGSVLFITITSSRCPLYNRIFSDL